VASEGETGDGDEMEKEWGPTGREGDDRLGEFSDFGSAKQISESRQQGAEDHQRAGEGWAELGEKPGEVTGFAEEVVAVESNRGAYKLKAEENCDGYNSGDQTETVRPGG
jgi:hypothetical protein